MPSWIAAARPSQWIKGVIIFAPMVLASKTADPFAWEKVLLTFGAFCLLASSAYIINDIHDREADRLHPVKKQRPIASRRLGVGSAVSEAAILGAMGLLLGWSAGWRVLVILTGYLILQALYTGLLRGRVLVDVIVLSIGFVLRAMAGAVCIPVEVSPWLFICTFTLSLFMGFCKRGNEIKSLGREGDKTGHRRSLVEYSPELLTHLITLSAAVAVVSFIMYSISLSTIARFGTPNLIYTLPLVVYGVFRFAMLSMKGVYAGPVDIIWHDRPFQVTVALWSFLAWAVIRWNSSLQTWFWPK